MQNITAPKCKVFKSPIWETNCKMNDPSVELSVDLYTFIDSSKVMEPKERGEDASRCKYMRDESMQRRTRFCRLTDQAN